MVEDGSGAAGYGEAATVPIWSGETAPTAKLLLMDVISPALLGHTFEDPAAACQAMDRALIGNPFLKAAVDTAIWDMVARRASVNVSRMIGNREPLSMIPTRGGISSQETGEALKQAQMFYSLGIRTLKLKAGLNPRNDQLRLQAIRDTFGDELQLTVDYNNGLNTLSDAVAAIEALLPFGLALVEQPTPRNRLHMMAQLRQRVSVPIMADEAVFEVSHLQEAIALEAMDLLSLYPGKNGGFTRSLQMARIAEKAGIPCVIGSNLETDLGMASMACLASSLTAFPTDRYASDLASSLFYRDITAAEARPLVDGCYVVPDAPGFGVDPCWLDRI